MQNFIQRNASFSLELKSGKQENASEKKHLFTDRFYFETNAAVMGHIIHVEVCKDVNWWGNGGRGEGATKSPLLLCVRFSILLFVRAIYSEPLDLL